MRQTRKVFLPSCLLWLVGCLLLLKASSGFAPMLFFRRNDMVHRHWLRLSQVATAAQDTDPNQEEEEEEEDTTTTSTTLVSTGKRTLYNVLGASPNASRAELKRNYVALARLTHPDAMIGRNSTTTVVVGADFAEIASAWRILSNEKSRKKYNRQLLAESFTDEVEKMAFEFGKQVAPAARHVVENWAMPFVERTFTTTMVSLSAAAEDLIDSSDFGHAMGAAFKAGQEVNRVIDRLELVDKSKELHQSAMNQSEYAMRLKAELTDLIDRRLQLTLETEHSAISSAEALKILDGLNTEDKVSLVDRARLRRKLQFEIEILEQLETEYYEKFDQEQTMSAEVEQLKESLQKSQDMAKAAIQKQEEARRALEEAQQEVIESRNELLENSREYESAQAQHRRTSFDLERSKTNLQRRQERVRKELKRKEDDTKRKGSEQSFNNNGATVVNDNDPSKGLTQLEELRKQEQYLIMESARLEVLAARLFDQAQQLHDRAAEMQKEQNEAP